LGSQTHFAGQDGGQIINVLEHQVMPTPQDAGAYFACFFRPTLLRSKSSVNGAMCFRDAHIGQRGDHSATRGIDHVEGQASGGDRQPLARDQSFRTKQPEVLQT
jgi:hypothetical protein